MGEITVSLNREKKEQKANQIREDFDNHDTLFLVDYVNIPVSKSIELRTQLRENRCSIKVIKNRLALKALEDEVPEEFKENFRGPTAIAYTESNPVHLARILNDFMDTHKILGVKAGIVEGQIIEGERFKEIATLGSRKELVTKIGYLMAAPLTQFLRTWQAPLTSVGSMLSQLKSKK
ncbi:MAG: 50S ribosomal protein L10 [Candidatus Aminicenantes bacterium]|nr:50S ribosomal protein L10 [Candidatus Aminicenantes bacterium]